MMSDTKSGHVLLFGVVLVMGFLYLRRQQRTHELEKMSVTNFVAAPGLGQSGSDIKCYPGADANVCRAECAADNSCVAYVANGPSGFSPTKTCCTKSKLDNITASVNSTLFSAGGDVIKNPDVVGWNIQTGKDIAGRDIACYTGGTQSRCQAQCAVNSACQAYNYIQPSQGGDWQNAGCCLKMTNVGISNNNNVTLWTKPT